MSENYFQDLKQLKALNLSHNNIASVSRITFSSLELLSVLSLRYNDLGVEVDYNTITNLMNTNDINLRQSGSIPTTELRIDGLRPWILPNLEYLDLGDNIFTIIRKERSPFSLSHRATTSSLRGQLFPNDMVPGQFVNQFQSDSEAVGEVASEKSGPEITNYWPSLRELKLDHCRIEFIEDNSFDALSSLTVLRLHDNRIKVSVGILCLYILQ